MAAVLGVTAARRGLAAALIVALPTLGACVQPGQPTPGPTPVSSTSPAPGSTTTQTKDPLASGGLLRLPITALPTNWNPLSSDGATPDADAVRAPLTAPAFTYDASGTPQANPDVVTRAVVTPTASGGPASTPTVVTLTLNPRAVWGDGTPVTASDWVATWTALTNPHNVRRSTPGWERVASVAQGADDHQVVVTYTRTDPDWAQPLASGPVRASSVADPTTYAQGWSAYRPDWFAGPYVITHTDVRQGVLTLEPSPRWWGSAPHLTRIFFRTTFADAVAADMAAGGFDLYSPGRDDALLTQARSAPDSAVKAADGGTGRVLTLSSTGVLASRAVRQAVISGIDRAKLARAVFDPVGVQATVWSNHLLLPQQPGYVDIARATGLGYDAKAAGDALSAAGFPLVDGVRKGPAGVLALSVSSTAGDARSAGEAAAVASDLAALGIEVRTVSTGGDLSFVSSDLGRYPLAGAPGRFSDVPGFGAIASGLDAMTDAPTRAGIATAAARLLWQEARTLPLYVEPQVAVVRTRLAGAGPSGLGSVDWTKVGFAS